MKYKVSRWSEEKQDVVTEFKDIPKGGFKINAVCPNCGKVPHVTIDFKLYECTICYNMEEKL